MEATILEGRREVKYVRAPIPEGAREFSRVIVEAAVSGGPNDQASLYLYRDVERLVGPISKVLVSCDELQLVTFSVPDVIQQELRPDEIGVAMQGRCPTAAIASIRLERRPLSTFVPPPHGDGVCERIGTLALRSFGFIAGQILETECTVDASTQIEMSLGLLPSANPDGSTVEVTVEASSSAGTKRRAFPVESGSWPFIELDHEWLAARSGILSNSERLAASVTTLAEVFAAAGYETGAAVSVSHIGSDRSGLGQGFDRFDGPSRDPRDGETAVDKIADWLQNLDDGPKFF